MSALAILLSRALALRFGRGFPILAAVLRFGPRTLAVAPQATGVQSAEEHRSSCDPHEASEVTGRCPLPGRGRRVRVRELGSRWRRAGASQRFGWTLSMLAILHYAPGGAAWAALNEDYPGMAPPARRSVAMVQAPADLLVNTWNANLFLGREELFIPSQGIPVDFDVSYNSLLNLEDGPFGFGWTFSYGVRLVPEAGAGLTLHWGDGRRDRFVPSGAAYTPVNEGVHVTLEAAGGGYKACIPERICYFFDDPAHFKLTRVVEPSGNELRLQYDADARLLGAYDADRFGLLFHYNAQDRVVEAVDSSTRPSRVWRYGYDSEGNLVRVDDPLGNVTTYGYRCPHLLSRIVDPLGTETLVEYTSGGQVERIHNAIERMEFASNLFARATAVREKVDDLTSRTTTYVYDTASRLVRVGDALGGVSTLGYDGGGNLASLTSPTGRTETYTYDSLGGTLTRTDGLGSIWTWTYEPQFHKVASFTDPLGHETRYEYDAAGRLIKIVDPDLKEATFTYDPRGRLTSASDRRGFTTRYDYDAYGNLASVTAPNGVAPWRYSYDSVHRRTSIESPLERVTGLAYDARDRLVRVDDALGGTTSFTYDAVDDLLAIVDPAGRSHTLDHDAIRRLIGYTGPDGGTTTYGYDAASRLIALTDAGGHSLSYAFDLLDSLVRLGEPLGSAWSFTYDGDGNRLTRTDPNGAVANYSYDAASQLTGLDYPGTDDDATYKYDADGKLTRAANGHADLGLTYDHLDRLASRHDATSGRVLGYAHDAEGNRTSLVDPQGGTFTYTYDADGRPSGIIDPAGGATFLGHDADNRLVSLTQPNGVMTTYGYDALGQLTTIDVRRPDGSAVFTGQYAYDGSGNRIQAVENGETIDYSYDAASRLTKATFGGRTIDYTYDADGNRLFKADSATGTTIYTYDGADRLVDASGAEARSYTSDANGNRLSESSAGGTTSYAYGPENDLASVTLPDGTKIDYRYDALGRRTTRTGPGTERTDWLRDDLGGGNVIAEYDASGSRISRYTSLAVPDAYLTHESPSLTLQLHADALGSVRAGTDGSGTTQASFSYLPFGEPRTATGSVGDRAFTAADAGAASDLVHLRQREYDARAGRFLQRDPLFGTLLDPFNLHPYVYVADNPQTYTDPHGEGFWFVVIAVVALVGLVAAATLVAVKDIPEPDLGVATYDTRPKVKAVIPATTPLQEFAAGIWGGIEAVSYWIVGGIFALFGLAGDSSSSPQVTPQDESQSNVFPRGPQTYAQLGANALDGVDANTAFAQGGLVSSTCGSVTDSFSSPGDGTVCGVDVSLLDNTLYFVGEGAKDGNNLFQTTRSGQVLRAGPVPVLGGGKGLSTTPNGLLVTHPTALGGSSAVMVAQDLATPLGVWVFDGPNNPNPQATIPMASDIEFEARLGPRGGWVALVASESALNLWEVELFFDQQPPASSSWELLSVRANRTGVPASGMGLGPDGLLSTWNGTHYLQDPTTLEVLGTCAAPGGPGTWGIAPDDGDGSGWATRPSDDRTDDGGTPGVSRPDTDADGHVDDCDNCPEVQNPLQADADGDGWGDICECDPFDPAVNPGAKEICGDGIDNDCDGAIDGASPFCAAVPEVTNLRVHKTAPEFTWDPAPGAGGYDLLRGGLENLAFAGAVVDLGPVSCIDLDSPDTATEKDPLQPATGKAFLYLVRVHHGVASYGASSSGAERVPGSGDCPAAP